jgi:hypothetical protein
MNTSTIDLLLSRVVDRGAAPEDWERLDAYAADDPNLWGELIARLRDDALVRDAVGAAIPAADNVPPPARSRGWLGRGRTVGLIAAAAVLLAAIAVPLGWWHTHRFAPPGSDSADPEVPVTTVTVTTPGGLAPAPAAVVEELPSVLISTRVVSDGTGVEVVYLRRTVERSIVDSVFTLEPDDAGVTSPRPVEDAGLLVSLPF